MSEQYRPVKGDRVRVVLEGEVGWVGSSGALELDRGASYLFPGDQSVVSIEKIEPPEETFKPGDVVRRQSDGNLLALAEDGWFNLTKAKFFKVNMTKNGYFTSAGFERVPLS